MNLPSSKFRFPVALVTLGLMFGGACLAGPFPALKAHTFRKSASLPGLSTEHYEGREMLVFAPPALPAPGQRALVVVLHGGLGNASRIEDRRSETGLNMDEVADRDGFIVAYLNGTPVARLLGPDMLGWNAGGGCCGVPAHNNVDDVAYITDAVHYLESKYGIDPQRVYGIGHSNGAMMTLRMMCDTSLYAAAISISGPLNFDVSSCPAARGKRILSIHGANDLNVPVAGGKGKLSLNRVDYKSEAYSQRVFSNSGADFKLLIVPHADHFLNHISARLEETEGLSVPEKAARFFGLDKNSR